MSAIPDNVVPETSETADDAYAGFSSVFNPGDIGGFGGQAANKKLEKQADQLKAQRDALIAQSLGLANQARDENRGDWNDLQTETFGADGNKLRDFYKGVQGQDAGNVQDLIKALGSYDNASELFNDPNFMGYVGDVQDQIKIDPRVAAAQQEALTRFRGLSQEGETPQDMLAREMARREMESNMRGDREAMAQRLKARGAYGSGAELTGQLMSQGEAASRRSLENMQAQAQAQQRQLAALGSYGDLAGQMRGQDLAEGSAHNAVSQFNNGLKQQAGLTRGGLQAQTKMGTEAELGKRAATGFEAQRGAIQGERADTAAENNARFGLTEGRTRANTADIGNVINVNGQTVDAYNQDRAVLQASHKPQGILGNLLGGF